MAANSIVPPPPGAAASVENTDAVSPADIEAGRQLFAQGCLFLGAVVDTAQLFQTELPEVAFAGRSNVGKSSLLNALTGRKTLARTSHTPGRTRQLNFFELGKRMILVDLPGYGYARAPKTDIRQWTALTRDYLCGRPQLRRVALLVDARHGLKDNDREILSELDRDAVSYQIVLTKADKLKPGPLDQVLQATTQELSRHPAAHPKCLVTSARSGLGIPELRAAFATLAAPPSG